MYTLKRRSRSPLTSLMAKAFKDRVEYLEKRGAHSASAETRRRPRSAKKAARGRHKTG